MSSASPGLGVAPIRTRAILVEVGRRGLVGHQEDMLVDIAFELPKSPDAH